MNLLCCAVVVLWLGWASLVEPASWPQKSIGAPVSRQLEDQGFEHFYSLEYDQAIAAFQKLRDTDPNNPNFRNHLASAYFYKGLENAGALQGDLFGASNKFFRGRKIQLDPRLVNGFWEANKSAVQFCERRVKQNKKDEEALYACGVAYATRAAYQGLVDRAKLDTFASARKASFYHSELARINPHRYDAYLVPGVYDYVLGALPGSLKFLLLFAGFSGDKERGIQAIESTAQWGDHSKQDAKILLTVVYRREKRFGDAIRTLGELAHQFPRNYIFPLEIASLDRTAGEEKEAIRAYEQVLEEIRAGKPGFSEAPAARIHYELGDLYWKTGNAESALGHLEKIAGSHGSTAELENQGATMRRQIEEAMHQGSSGKPEALKQ